MKSKQNYVPQAYVYKYREHQKIERNHRKKNIINVNDNISSQNKNMDIIEKKKTLILFFKQKKMEIHKSKKSKLA